MKVKIKFIFFVTALTLSGQLEAQNYFANKFSVAGSFAPVLFDGCSTSDGGFIATGYTSDIVSLKVYSCLFKGDLDGNFQWAKGFKSNDFELYCWLNLQSLEGGYLLGGNAHDSLSHSKVFFTKINSFGIVSWAKCFMLPVSNSANALVQSRSDSSYYILCGGCAGMFVVKMDKEGNFVWSKNYSNPAMHPLGFDMIETSDGNIVITGPASDYPLTQSNSFILKIDTNGGVLWSKMYLVENYDCPEHIVELSNGDLFISGIGMPPSSCGCGNPFFLQLDSLGNVLRSDVVSINTSRNRTRLLLDLTGVTLLFQPYNNDNKRFFLKYDNSGNLFLSNTNEESTFRMVSALTHSGNDYSIISYDGNYVQMVYEKVDNLFTQFCMGFETENLPITSPLPQLISFNVNVTTPSIPMVNPVIRDTTLVYSTSTCYPVGLQELNDNSIGVNIFPNPISSTATITFKPELEIRNLEMKIFDVTGREVRQLKLQVQNTSLERGNLRSGIYFYSVRDGAKQIATGKFAVE